MEWPSVVQEIYPYALIYNLVSYEKQVYDKGQAI